MIGSVCATGSVSRCVCSSERVRERGGEGETARARARARLLGTPERGVQGIAGSVTGSGGLFPAKQ
jgi:hypothetical protein